MMGAGAGTQKEQTPLRVLFVIPGEGLGSSMIFALRQADSLRRCGVEVQLFYLRSRTSPSLLIQEWRRFRREQTAFRAHVVHAHFGTMTGLFAACAAGLTPLVITYRGSDLNSDRGHGSPSRSAAGRFLSQLAALRAQRIVCVSRQLKDQLWWRRHIAVVHPSGVEPDSFCPEPQQLARQRLRWKSGDRVVLFNAGHNPRIKRLDLARAAIQIARNLIPDVRLNVLDGSIPPATMPSYMNAADCLLLTSDAEGSPTVIQEALACNLPVVSVDVGDTAHQLRGVQGTRIVARDAEALGQALASLLAHGGRSAGRERILEFSSLQIARELTGIYESLAAPIRDRKRRAA